MIRFFCCCGAEIFFENSHCGSCGSVLGFDPKQQKLLALQADQGGRWIDFDTQQRYLQCEHHLTLGCNWLIGSDDHDRQCLSCRSTRTIPALALAKNLLLWQRLEQTKRRALYMLLRLGLPICRTGGLGEENAIPVLKFDFLEDRRTNPDVVDEFVYSGHKDGVITINAAEADDSFRATHRELMNELYRTLLGHFRHELGHYYGFLLNGAQLTEFRSFFGDEQTPYQTALDRYYEQGVGKGWRARYISAYASSHPWEDWAETWAHYLHINDTMETAIAYGIMVWADNAVEFENMLSSWAELTVTLNALNRSMGVDDAYPFIITSAVRAKLCFIDRLVKAWRVSGHNAAGT